MGEWKRVKLGEICSRVCSGGTPRSNVAEYYESGSIPWLNTKEVIFGRIYSTEKCITESGLENSSAKWIEANAVVVAMYGATAGNVAITRIPLTTNQACCNLQINPENADADFVFYYLKWQYHELCLLANGAAQQNLNAQVIKDFEIDLPALPTQRRIAAVLGALDDKIEVNRKICENLEAQAQALFKAWFVCDGSRVQATKQMQEVFDVTIGRTPPRKEFEWFSESKDDNVTWASIADMGSCGMFLADSSEYLTPAAVQRFKLVMIPRGTVLLSFKLTVGRVAIADVDMVSNEAIAHLRTDNMAMREYLYCYLKQYDFDKLGSTSSIATAVNSTTIKEMPFRVPTDAALVDFYNVAKPIFDLIRSKSRESRALAAMRDALLPKLMSGELAAEKVDG